MSLRFRHSLAALAALALLGGCDREERHARGKPLGETVPASASPDTIWPGNAPPRTGEQAGGQPTGGDVRAQMYEDNAFNIAQGQRLYLWMNCVGCHAHGGGGMGPP